MKHRKKIFLCLAAISLVGCATLPIGPSVMVLPPEGKTFEQFQAEYSACRQWAAGQIGLNPQETANQNTAAGAIAGTAIGAGLGAALGSSSGHAGTGAAIGAAAGLLTGTAAGASAGQVYGWEAQRRYDMAYQQCMYAKGNQIPGMVPRTRRVRHIPPPPPPDFEPPSPESYEPYQLPPPGPAGEPNE